LIHTNTAGEFVKLRTRTAKHSRLMAYQSINEFIAMYKESHALTRLSDCYSEEQTSVIK